MAESNQWRIYITDNHGSSSFVAAVAEIEMASEAAGVNLCTGGNSISISDHPTFTSDRAFDGIRDNTTYGWLPDSSEQLPVWIGYTFNNPVQIREFRITAATSGLTGSMASSLKDFILQYFDGNNWIDVSGASYTDEAIWTDYEERTYSGDLSSNISSTTLVKGKCVLGSVTLPAQREIWVYSMVDGTYLAYADTDEYGDFNITLPNGTSEVFLRIVDPEGIYSTEIRENITPEIIVSG